MADLRLWFAAMAAVACQPALADGGKTVTGRCLAVIDGKTEQNGPCSIDLAVGGGFSFETLNDDGVVRLVPDGTTHRGAASVTSQDGAPGKDATTALGTLKQDGACWTGARAKICAWDGKAEMLRNRAAPYTAFHTLLGKSIQARCQMGGCEWFRYDRATLVTHNDREAVLKIDGQEWTTSHPDYDYDRPRRRNDVTNGSFYFRCSHTRPAALWKSRGKDWTLNRYAPDGDGGVSGAEQYASTQFAAACDGLDHAVEEEEGRLLGYDTGGDRGESDILIGGPADALR